MAFLSAHTDVQTVREGIETGGCAFLTKPYQLEEPRTAAADAVERRSGHVNLPDGLVRSLHREC